MSNAGAPVTRLRRMAAPSAYLVVLAEPYAGHGPGYLVGRVRRDFDTSTWSAAYFPPGTSDGAQPLGGSWRLRDGAIGGALGAWLEAVDQGREVVEGGDVVGL